MVVSQCVAILSPDCACMAIAVVGCDGDPVSGGRLRNSIRTLLPPGKPGGKATSGRAWCRFHTLRPDPSPQRLCAKLDWLVRQRAAGDIFPYVIRHQSYLVCGSATDANVLCAAPVRVQRTNPRTRHYASNLTVNLRVCFA